MTWFSSPRYLVSEEQNKKRYGQEFHSSPANMFYGPRTHCYLHPRGPHDPIPCYLSFDFASILVKDDGKLFITEDVYILCSMVQYIHITL